MIDIFSGTPGSGKSITAWFEAVCHLLRGGIVATNFKVRSDWSEVLCNRSWRVKYGFIKRDVFKRDLESRLWFINSAPAFYDFAPLIPYIVSGSVQSQREGRCLAILDEAQFYFNSRNWVKNQGFLELFTQHRKLGYDFILCAHNMDMLDKQIRFLVEYETFFRNFSRVKIPLPLLNSFRLSPVDSFLAIRQYANMGSGKAMKQKTWFQPLIKDLADLYESFEVFSFDDPPEPPTLHVKRNPPSVSTTVQPAWPVRPPEKLLGFILKCHPVILFSITHKRRSPPVERRAISK